MSACWFAASFANVVGPRCHSGARGIRGFACVSPAAVVAPCGACGQPTACGWACGQPAGLSIRPSTGERPRAFSREARASGPVHKSTGLDHGRGRNTSKTPNTPRTAMASRPDNVRKGGRKPARRHPLPTISSAQPSTEPQTGHVPEITGHVRRNTHLGYFREVQGSCNLRGATPL